MLAAFLVHRPDVTRRVSARQLRNKFCEEMRLGSRPVEPFVGKKDDLLQKHPLGVEQELHRAPVRPAKGAGHAGLGRFGTSLGQFSHGNLLSDDIVKEYGTAQSWFLSFIKPGDRPGLDLDQIALPRPE
jgi:hypothetical protein